MKCMNLSGESYLSSEQVNDFSGWVIPLEGAELKQRFTILVSHSFSIWILDVIQTFYASTFHVQATNKALWVEPLV